MASVKKEEVEESMAPVKKERTVSVKKEEVEEEHREEAKPKMSGRMITRSAFKRKLEESSSDVNNNQQQQQRPKGKKQKKMKEEISVEKGEDELSSVQKGREEVANEARELIKRWQLSARQRDLEAKSSSDVDQQEEEGKPKKKRKTPEERPRFSYQERWAYKRRLKESGGFDVGDVPDNVDPRLTPISPYKVFGRPHADIRLKKVEKYSKLALDKYNKDNKTKFEFGKFLKANVTTYSCRLWYVTFQSKHMPGFRPKNFQAVVHTNQYDEGDVKLCKRVT
ncbi:uncharacterized protein LOC131298360 isoform X2 [Rhododendron vialii]|uniref:uncharacterized protein LOC131298360 isoform X2 n=1 Tax=Rhododendron vialii TaxID=182163 RepID=UPI00266033BD|nr:uncharacterized protein LOC131298360 isoform X2 [Rhododendron vialii]